MKTIQAMVNPRLLTKANRLFTGSLEGRVIEILQNARRAGATEVVITNLTGLVTVRDNGKGIDDADWAALLDLGRSGWAEALEASEDPAGVGLFCLAPRDVTIRSNGKIATICGKGWTGDPVYVHEDPNPVQGTVLEFFDDPWDTAAVDLNAVFCGMKVTVDGTVCPQTPFVSDQATAHPELGCRIEVRESQGLTPWHHSSKRRHWYGHNVLVNFHGQVVAHDHHPVSEHRLEFLVDMTDEPTGIRLMLPARTCLVQNEALQELHKTLKLEAFRFLQKRGCHELPYKQYLEARELGIVLPEAEPTFKVGLLTGDSPEPIEVPMPKDFPLARCLRFDSDFPGRQEIDHINVHLLAAVGKFEEPFIPADIRSEYDGYSWAKLPTIGKVELAVGKDLLESTLWSGKLVCVDSLTVTAHANDGRVFSSPVCMAIRKAMEDPSERFYEEVVLVTPEAQERLKASDIWYHLGGFYDDGDTFDTQLSQFAEELEHFWAELIGPDEQLRRELMAPLVYWQQNWQSVTLLPEGTVTLRFKDGTERIIRPPATKSTK